MTDTLPACATDVADTLEGDLVEALNAATDNGYTAGYEDGLSAAGVRLRALEEARLFLSGHVIPTETLVATAAKLELFLSDPVDAHFGMTCESCQGVHPISEFLHGAYADGADDAARAIAEATTVLTFDESDDSCADVLVTEEALRVLRRLVSYVPAYHIDLAGNDTALANSFIAFADAQLA